MVRPFFKGYVHRKAANKQDSLGFLNTEQNECIELLSQHILMDQELYMIDHPEIILLLKVAVANLDENINSHLSQLAHFYLRPKEELHNELERVYGKSLIAEQEAAVTARQKKHRLKLKYDGVDLYRELAKIVKKYVPSAPDKCISRASSSITTSSSFLSLDTGETTPKTPEPEPEPVVTISQIFYSLISATVNKATMLKVTDEEIKYDVAYVVLMKIVEDVMELVVEDIKEDIRELYEEAYKGFEKAIKEKQDQAAAIAWENRMRKKLKRLLRRQKNFKGYETPPSPKSEVSEHPSYKLSPQQICVCHPKWQYNRYPKDRFGLYLPNEIKYEAESLTIYPEIPVQEKRQEETEG